MALQLLKSDLVRLRPAQTEDSEGLKEVFTFLNSPHASPDNVDAIIGATQNSLARDEGMTHLTVVAETLDSDTLEPKNIVAGGSLVKMSGGESAPLLYKTLEDGSMELFKYERPTLEFGGMVAHPEARGVGIGMAVSAVRALVARHFAHLFGAKFVLSDFMPPLDDIDTKENAFWDGMILNCLIQEGNLDAVKKLASELTGTEIKTNTELSAAIGNIISDDDRNRMVMQYWPKTIQPDLVTQDAITITQNVNGPTVQARANLLALYGKSMSPIGCFPINGGPNYVAKVHTGPRIQKRRIAFGEDVGKNRSVLFNPFESGLSVGAPTPDNLRSFSALWAPASVDEATVTVSEKVGRVLEIDENSQVYCYTPPRNA